MAYPLVQVKNKPVVVYTPYVKMTGSIKAGYLLSYVMNEIVEKGNDIVLQDKDIRQLLGFKRNEFNSCKAILKELPFLTIKSRGFPQRTHYSVDWTVYDKEVLSVKRRNNK